MPRQRGPLNYLVFESINFPRWSKASISQSKVARQIAQVQLAGAAFQDGAFIIRPSTTRTGSIGDGYFIPVFIRSDVLLALSLKFEGDVTHLLILCNENGTYQLKDGVRQFPSIPSLIFHHCLHEDGFSVVGSSSLF